MVDITSATIPTGGAMRPFFARFGIATLLVLLLLSAISALAAAAPEGTMTWGLHVTLVTRWLDPSDTEAFINPFMAVGYETRVLLCVHADSP